MHVPDHRGQVGFEEVDGFADGVDARAVILFRIHCAIDGLRNDRAFRGYSRGRGVASGTGEKPEAHEKPAGGSLPLLARYLARLWLTSN